MIEAILDFFIDPWRFNFILRGLQASILVSLACATLGTFVVLRGMAFLGDALAHTVLPGIVVAFLLGINLFIGALIAGFLTAIGIGWISRTGDLSEDTTIGIMFSGFFALGIALLSRVNSYRDLTHILFGNILGISQVDIYIMIGVVLIVLIGIVAFYRELVLFTFDTTHSVSVGVSVAWMRYILLALLVLAIVSAIQAVGVVLVISLLVTPAATAYLITNRLPTMMVASVIISLISAVVGLYTSFYLDISSGPVIVLVLTMMFLLVFLFAPARGVIWQRSKRTSPLH